MTDSAGLGQMYCTNCGGVASASAAFCGHCGSGLAQAPAAPAGTDFGVDRTSATVVQRPLPHLPPLPPPASAPVVPPAATTPTGQPAPQPDSIGQGMRDGARRVGEGLSSLQRRPGTGLGIHDDPTDYLPFIKVQWGALMRLFVSTVRQVFRRHRAEDAEAEFGSDVGRDPDPAATPGPWVFSRVLVAGTMLFLITYAIYWVYGAQTFYPMALILGAATVPIATGLFFLEANSPRNISFYRWTVFLLVGGVLSLLFTIVLQLFDTVGFSSLGSMTAPFFEEPAKLAAVVLLAQGIRFPWVINGLVLGAAVGAGFDFMETAGYLHSSSDLLSLAQERGMWAFGAHIVWTGVAAGALWAVKQDKPFNPAMLVDKMFLIPFALVVLLHALWNSPLNAGLHLIVQPLVAGASLLLALTYLAAGLKQYTLARQQGIEG